MSYEAIYMGPKGSRVRYNNGQLNYIDFASGVPVAVDDGIAEQLRTDKQFIVRAAAERLEPVPETADPPEKKSHLFGKKRTTSKRV